MAGDPIAFLADLMHRGGPVMWPIVLCSLVAVSVTLRKACQWLWWRWAVRCGAGGWAGTLAALRGGASEPSAALGCSPYAALVAEALGARGAAFPTALEQAARCRIRSLRRGLGVLDTVVTLAPMLGILGTVTGIIASFDLLGAAGAEDPAGVTAGIAEALITTAAGLVVSIVALLPLNYGRAWIRDAVRALEEAMTLAEEARAEALSVPKPTADETP